MDSGTRALKKTYRKHCTICADDTPMPDQVPPTPMDITPEMLDSMSECNIENLKERNIITSDNKLNVGTLVHQLDISFLMVNFRKSSDLRIESGDNRGSGARGR